MTPPRPPLPRSVYPVWTAPDGRRATIRPLVESALEQFAEFVRHLSAASRARRFLVGVRELSADAARRLVRVDPRREVAWVAEDGSRPGVIVGEARYVLTAPGAAELALAVADDWQRRGLGSFLLGRLLEHGSAAGLALAWGHVRRDNEAALAVARQFCFDVTHEPDEPGVLVVGRPLLRRLRMPGLHAGGRSRSSTAGTP